MKAKLTGLEVEAFRVTEKSLPSVLNALQTYPASQWSLNWGDGVGILLQVTSGGQRHTASDGDWLVRIRDAYRVIPDELFGELFELESDVPLPDAVWVPEDGMMARMKTALLPRVVDKNYVLGSYVESSHHPHGVRGFFMDFFPDQDAVREARVLAPRVAKLLGFDNALGMTRLVPVGEEVEPGTLERFWFTLCNEHGYALKEEK